MKVERLVGKHKIVVMVTVASEDALPILLSYFHESQVWWCFFPFCHFPNTAYKNKAFHGNWKERAFPAFQKYDPNSAKMQMVKVSMKSVISRELCLFRCAPQNAKLGLLSIMRVKGRLIWFVIVFLWPWGLFLHFLSLEGWRVFFLI